MSRRTILPSTLLNNNGEGARRMRKFIIQYGAVLCTLSTIIIQRRYIFFLYADTFMFFYWLRVCVFYHLLLMVRVLQSALSLSHFFFLYVPFTFMGDFADTNVISKGDPHIVSQLLSLYIYIYIVRHVGLFSVSPQISGPYTSQPSLESLLSRQGDILHPYSLSDDGSCPWYSARCLLLVTRRLSRFSLLLAVCSERNGGRGRQSGRVARIKHGRTDGNERGMVTR